MIKPVRPRRSVLYMPGSNARALEKARTLPADGFIFDLEDAVAPDAKLIARQQICEAVKAGGYTPAVYFYPNTGYYGFELSKLTDYMFWLGRPGSYPDFYYAHAVWQYDFEGKVDGIKGNADMDMYFTPVQK